MRVFLTGALRSPAGTADGVIRTAFNHDFSNLRQHSEQHRNMEYGGWRTQRDAGPSME
jgi:hypothetical protein